jgi:tyrosine-protein phosphatase non-receptor type 14/21
MDTLSTSMMNQYNSSNKNINESLNGNENAKYIQHHYLISNNDIINNGNGMSVSASKISVSQDKDVNLNNIPASASVTSLYQNQQMKQRQQQNNMINTNTSGTSLNYSVNTNTTDSRISAEMAVKKEKGEKRNKIWNILSGKNKTSTSKQKSATLGREKDKKKKEKDRDMGKDAESNLRHRWSTGLPRLQPLPANISKEKLCQLLETKLNDSQLFLELERIPKRKENAQYSCALMEENRNKNSEDRASLPMDENRVKLIPTRENRMGYVNASHIMVMQLNREKILQDCSTFDLFQSTVGRKQRFFIAAQSPVDQLTANTFWQCVWEADVYLLVQLSDDFSYVPTNSERCLEYGQVRKIFVLYCPFPKIVFFFSF